MNSSKYSRFGLSVKVKLLQIGKDQKWLEGAISEKLLQPQTISLVIPVIFVILALLLDFEPSSLITLFFSGIFLKIPCLDILKVAPIDSFIKKVLFDIIEKTKSQHKILKKL